MTGPQLTRFFFHILGGGQAFRDDTGEVFSTVHAAEKHAVRIAYELRHDAYQDCAIHVLDAAGTEVARVPIGGGDRAT
jgi:hypothetical protein